MRLVPLLALGFTVLTAAAASGDPCAWGQAYWCSNLQQSKQCDATRHCIDNVWKGQQMPEDDDEVCDICKEMVKEARDQLRSNQTLVSI